MNGENESIRVPGTPVTGVTGSSQNEPSSSQNEPRNRPARRGRRGTRMADVTLSRTSGKQEIQFNDMLEPFGHNKSNYNSFLGTLARSKVSILTDEWKNVDEKLVKAPIWDTIRLTYTVPDCQKLKDKTLSYCADRWRKFKTFLANKYIFAEVPPEKNPWDTYTYIDEQTWQQFVQLRTTPEALKRRQQAQEIGRKNDCPHRASRGGYEKAEKDLMAAKRKRLEDEAESNPSTIVDQPSPIRREELWLHIRQKPSGAYTSEQTRLVAERIEDLKKKEAEGSFVSDGRNDVLTVATGKPDHPGRVRGIGGRVGIKQVFGKSKRHRQSMVTREEMEQTVAKISEEAASREAMFHAEMSQMKEQMNQMRLLLKASAETSVPFTHSPATMQQSTRGSCIVGQSEQHCDLYVEDPDSHKRLLVAKGTVHQNLGSTVHNQQMADDEVRVSVEKVIIDAPLPLSTDELKLVSHVKGTFISWPVKLVHVSTHHEASSPPRQAPSPPRQSPSPPRQVPPPTAKLTAKEKISAMVKSGYFKDRYWPVNEVVGLRNPRPALVDAVDIKSLLVHGEELSDAIIQMFMK